MKQSGLTGQDQHAREANPPRKQEHPKDRVVSLPALSRRAFLRRASGVTVATLAADAFGGPIVNNTTRVEAEEIGPVRAKQRRQQAYHLRKEAAQFQRDLPLPAHPDGAAGPDNTPW